MDLKTFEEKMQTAHESMKPLGSKFREIYR